MQFVNIIKKNKIALSVFILIVVIIILGISIYWANNSNKTVSVSSLKGYSALKQKISNLAKNEPELEQDALYQKTASYTQQIASSSKKDSYDNTARGYDSLTSLYSITSNPKLVPIIKAYSLFAKENFPSEYKSSQFVYLCQDPTCAETPQPPEILKIIDEIKQSDFPKQVQKDTAQNLLTTGYLPKANEEQKFNEYLFMVQALRNYGEFSKSGENIKISDELYNFVKKAFPKNFESIKNSVVGTQSGLLKPEDFPKK